MVGGGGREDKDLNLVTPREKKENPKQEGMDGTSLLWD